MLDGRGPPFRCTTHGRSVALLDLRSKYANTVAGCASRHSNTPPPAPRKKTTSARRRSTEKTEPSGPKIPRSRFPARSHPPPEASHVVSNASIRCDAIDAFCRIVASPHRCARVNKLATSSPRKGSSLAPHARAPLTPVIRALRLYVLVFPQSSGRHAKRRTSAAFSKTSSAKFTSR